MTDITRPAAGPESTGPLDDRAVEGLLSGRRPADATRADAALAELFAVMRSDASGPAPTPNAALAGLLAAGGTWVAAAGGTWIAAAGGTWIASAAPGAAARDVVPPGLAARAGLLGLLFGRSKTRSAATGAAVVAFLTASLVGAAAANALPSSAQRAVSDVVRAITPLRLPSPDDHKQPAPAVSPSPSNDAGGHSSGGPSSGGPDGRASQEAGDHPGTSGSSRSPGSGDGTGSGSSGSDDSRRGSAAPGSGSGDGTSGSGSSGSHGWDEIKSGSGSSGSGSGSATSGTGSGSDGSGSSGGSDERSSSSGSTATSTATPSASSEGGSSGSGKYASSTTATSPTPTSTPTGH